MARSLSSFGDTFI